MPQIADKMGGIDFIVDSFIRAIPLTEKIDDKLFSAKHTGNDTVVSNLLPQSMQKASLSEYSALNKKRCRFKLHDDPNMSCMIKEIQDNLVQKFNKGLLLKSKQVYKKIPWKQLNREDFVNWPNDVGLYRITDQKRQSLLKLYRNLDSINFTKECLVRYAKRLKRSPESNRRDKLISKLAFYFQNKLASRLEVADIRRIRIPWGKIKENDIINWPKNFNIGTLSRLPVNGLLALNELAKKDELNFSSEFLNFIRESRKTHKN